MNVESEQAYFDAHFTLRKHGVKVQGTGNECFRLKNHERGETFNPHSETIDPPGGEG